MRTDAMITRNGQEIELTGNELDGPWLERQESQSLEPAGLRGCR